MAAINTAWLVSPANNIRAIHVPAPDCCEADRAFALAFEKLKPRCQQILRLRCEGLMAPQIAERMFVSEPAIKNDLTIIYRCLGVGGHGSMGRVAYLLGRFDRARECQANGQEVAS